MRSTSRGRGVDGVAIQHAASVLGVIDAVLVVLSLGAVAGVKILGHLHGLSDAQIPGQMVVDHPGKLPRSMVVSERKFAFCPRA